MTDISLKRPKPDIDAKPRQYVYTYELVFKAPKRDVRWITIGRDLAKYLLSISTGIDQDPDARRRMRIYYLPVLSPDSYGRMGLPRDVFKCWLLFKRDYSDQLPHLSMFDIFMDELRMQAGNKALAEAAEICPAFGRWLCERPKLYLSYLNDEIGIKELVAIYPGFTPDDLAGLL